MLKGHRAAPTTANTSAWNEETDMTAKRRMWIVSLAAAGLCGCTYNGHFYVTQRAEFRQTADIQGVSSLVVETRNGGVEVRCDPAVREASVSGTKTASATTVEAALEVLERIKIRTGREAGRPDTLHIVAEFPIEPNLNAGASFEIVVPPAMAMDIRTSNGRIQVTDAARDLKLHTSNGPIRTARIDGRVKATTSNGAVSLEDVTGDVEALSSNGPVELRRVGSKQVQARTSNGRIRAMSTRGNIHLETTNSPVELETGWLPPKPEVRVSSANGGIKVHLPSTVAAQLRLDTSNGRVSTDFGTTQVGALRTSSAHVEAELNGGGGQIEFRTSNGPISFKLVPTVAESQP